MYSYSVRKAGNPELYKAFDARVEKMGNNSDYPTLHNVLYYMMFRDNANKKVWQNIVESVIQNEYHIPIIYFRPFKASEIFIKHHFPEWDLRDYTDKFWSSERYFNILDYDIEYFHESDYWNFKCFLNAKCFVYPIPLMTKHNLFKLHFVFNEYKIAINFHLERTLIYGKKEPSELLKFGSKILKYEGWEILELSELEFNDWTYDERINNIKGWLTEAKLR